MNFDLVQFENEKKENKFPLKNFTEEEAKKVKKFHESFDMYEMTPLCVLENTAKILGVNNFYVKDESYRFGLNAFKVLGGSFAMANYIAKKIGRDISELGYRDLISEDVRKKIGDVTFITATDGNHGRGVAWTANQLKQKCIVYMPKGSSKERLENIRKEGADAEILDLNYDECVRKANEDAEKNGFVLVQDTAWDGYEEIPLWIMQGYMTMAYETILQIEEKNLKRPTHLFLQAGVGSMASAVTAVFSNHYKDNPPIITIVEPEKANPIYKTAKNNDGKIYNVTGDMDTIMAGLACGEPCTIAWNILKDYAQNFISCPDYVAAKGMRILSSPEKNDDNLISGESGAAAFGLVSEVLENVELKDMKEKLKLDENSVCVFMSTEGNTDKKHYRDVIWNGKYPSYK